MVACDPGWADPDCHDQPAGQPDHRTETEHHWPASETGAETPDMSPAPTLVECQESGHGVDKLRVQGKGEGEHHREYNSYCTETQLSFEM